MIRAQTEREGEEDGERRRILCIQQDDEEESRSEELFRELNEKQVKIK